MKAVGNLFDRIADRSNLIAAVWADRGDVDYVENYGLCSGNFVRNISPNSNTNPGVLPFLLTLRPRMT